MLNFSEVKISDLPKNNWAVVKNDDEGTMQVSHFIVKVEEDKVSVVYVYETDAYGGSYTHDGVAMVVHENAFMYDTYLAKYSLRTMSLMDLVYDGIENDNNLVFDFSNRNNSFLTGAYPNYSELSKLVYNEDLVEESMNFQIEGKQLVIL